MFTIFVTSFHSHLFNLRMVFVDVDFKLHQGWDLVNLQHLFMMPYKIFHHQLQTSSWSAGTMNFKINFSTTLKEDSEEHIHLLLDKFLTNSQNQGHWNFIVVLLHLRLIYCLHPIVQLGLYLAFPVLRNWLLCVTASSVRALISSSRWLTMYGKASLFDNSCGYVYVFFMTR